MVWDMKEILLYAKHFLILIWEIFVWHELYSIIVMDKGKPSYLDVIITDIGY